MPVVRNATIDAMRGYAVIVMIFLHVSAFYLSNTVTFFFWNYLHFVVPHFIFCSAFLEFSKPPKQMSLNIFWRRIKRLIIPHWIYVVIVATVGWITTGQLHIVSLLNKLLLLQTNSRNYDWLVFLFICLAIIVPTIHHASKNIRRITLISILSMLSALLLIWYDPPFPFRFVMVIPWIFFVTVVWWIVYLRSRIDRIALIMIGSVLVFFIMGTLLNRPGSSTILTENKYPPNLFYLSYGIFWTLASYLIFNRYIEILPKAVKNLLHFLSRHSYSIFFIHFFLLNYLLKFRAVFEVGVIINTAILIALSLFIQLIFNACFAYLESKKIA